MSMLMTTLNRFHSPMMPPIVAGVVNPRGRRMPWRVARKYREAGKQEGPI